MRVTVEKIINNAYGLSHTDEGKALFIPYAVDGDILECSVTDERKNFSFAKIDEVLTPSKYRKSPICPYYGICGGCDMLHIDYSHTLRIKEEWIKNDFSHFSNLIKIHTIINKNDISYRSRAKFSVSSTAKGFLKKNSKEVVNIEKCILLTNGLNEILSQINPRKGLKNDEVITTTVLEGSPKFKVGEKAINADNTVFFQQNRDIALSIAEYITKNISGIKVYDFYGGVGFFSSFLEDSGYDVSCIESNENCKKFATFNLKKSRFYSLSTEDATKVINNKCDTSVVDPPRVGMTKKAVKTVSSLTREKIIYVSCDYKTAIRDLEEFKKYGFIAREVTPFDMFPYTSHLECVILLDKV